MFAGDGLETFVVELYSEFLVESGEFPGCVVVPPVVRPSVEVVTLSVLTEPVFEI